MSLTQIQPWNASKRILIIQIIFEGFFLQHAQVCLLTKRQGTNLIVLCTANNIKSHILWLCM